jgi:transmembrane sensor
MDESYEQLILKYFAGTATDEEQQQLDHWAQKSPENKKLLEDYQRIWKLDSRVAPNRFDTDAELNKLEKILDLEVRTSTKRHWTLQPTVFKVAASIVLIAVCSIVLYRFATGTEIIVKESGAERLQVSLPDGSSVWLNEHSQITYNSDFESERHVKLEGEGFFDVTRNPNKPFVIQSTVSTIEVLGTTFNVRTIQSEIQDEVYVVTGKVSLADESNHKIVLTAGQLGIHNKASHVLAHVEQDDPNLIAWKTKKLIFKKTDLASVAETLERYFGVSIVFRNPDLQACRFTSSFEDPTLEEVIDALSIALNLNIVHQNEHYTFDGESCHP